MTVQHDFLGFGGNGPAFDLDRFGYLPDHMRVSNLLDLDLGEGGDWRRPFELPGDSRRELKACVSSLDKEATRLGPEGDGRLAALLRDAFRVRRPTPGLANLANPTFRLPLRNRLCSHVFRAFAERDPSHPATFHTVIPNTLQVPAGELCGLKISDVWGSLIKPLNRCGFASLPGWTAIGLHGEHNAQSGLLHLHFHALTVGPKAEAFERLRQLVEFQSGGEGSAHRPIVRQAADNPPRQICYLFQGWWPSKRGSDPVGLDDGRGLRKRIPEPDHAAWVLWMARRRLSDLVRFQGIEIRDGFLMPTHPGG